jgi:hypothetical protein
VPNEGGLTPSQQATVTTATANRNATNTRSTNQINAANQRAANAQAGANQRAANRGTRGTSGGRAKASPFRKEAESAISTHIANLQAIDEQIKAANALPDDRDKQGNSVKMNRLRGLGAERQEEIDKAKQTVNRLKQLDTGYEIGMGEQGYPYKKENCSI